MTLADLYRLSVREGAEGLEARRLFRQWDWFARMMDFDLRSGEALTQSLSPFLRKVARDALLGSDEHWKTRDRLSRLTEHCREALKRVIRGLNENPRREHAEMPIRNVRELDAACFKKLSNRPGRTIREKLASKPYLQAVRRYQSIDLPENRLVKAFAQRLVELLRERAECLGAWLQEKPDELIGVLERWLRSNEARAISFWDNPPPNNMLLSHRDYRKIYDSWRWMQSLDTDAASDFIHVKDRQMCMEYWQYVAELRFVKKMRLDEVPIEFAYDKFFIRPLLSEGVWKHGDNRPVPAGKRLDHIPKYRPEELALPEVETPACIDFTGEKSVFTTGEHRQELSVPLAWQLWETQEGCAEISLFEALATYEGDGVTTVRVSDFFTSPDAIREHAHRAALSIAADLRRVFRSDSLVWLVPDIVDDFQLTPLRQGVNTMFGDAAPVPRSIAAAVQKVDVTKLWEDKKSDKSFAVAVIDRLGDDVFVTRLAARYEERLAAALPVETRGYAWERQPAVRIAPELIRGNRVEFDDLVRLVGPIYYTVYVKEPPVQGGILLREREKKVPDIPLWYDQLPELSTKIPINGIYDYFYLVQKRNAKVSPRRGVAKPIRIEQPFTLPAGQREYEFPLYMGSGHNASQFVASLRSSAFPLKSAVKCTLKMTYTYGDSQPYSLTFLPQDKVLKPMTAVWERKKPHAVDGSALPAPDFPVRNCWDTLAKDGLLQQVADGFDEIHAYVSGARSAVLIAKQRKKFNAELVDLERSRRKLSLRIGDVNKKLGKLKGSTWSQGVVDSPIGRDKNNTLFCFVRCGQDRVFCHSSVWSEDISDELFSRGDKKVWISLWRDPSSKKNVAVWTSVSAGGLEERIGDGIRYIAELEEKLCVIDRQIAAILEQQSSVSESDVRPIVAQALRRAVKACRVPVSAVWDNARSCRDVEAPEWFRQRIGNALLQFDADLQSDAVPAEFKNVLSKLLYLLHKDIPMSLVEVDKRDIAEHGTDAFSLRHVGYALGDAGMDWQRELLVWMLAQADYGYFPVFRAFSIALWRCESLVRRLQPEDCRLLCRALKESIGQIIGRIESVASSSAPESDNARVRLFVDVASARYNFEVMLALIRTRKGSDAEVARMFVPGSPVSVMLLDLVDSFAKVLSVHQLKLISRISLNIDKPEQVGKMPDLLYALRLFLSGEDGANTISINEVGDDEAGDEENPHESEPAPHRDGHHLSREVFARFRDKIVVLGQSVHVRYRPDKDKIRELQKGVWGCQYRTEAYEERPWEQAFVCVHPQHGCCETHGGICEYWNKMGGWTSPLGLPISDEEDFYENNQLRGRVSHFEHGDVIWLNEENRIDVRMKV